MERDIEMIVIEFVLCVFLLLWCANAFIKSCKYPISPSKFIALVKKEANDTNSRHKERAKEVIGAWERCACKNIAGIICSLSIIASRIVFLVGVIFFGNTSIRLFHAIFG